MKDSQLFDICFYFNDFMGNTSINNSKQDKK